MKLKAYLADIQYCYPWSLLGVKVLHGHHRKCCTATYELRSVCKPQAVAYSHFPSRSAMHVIQFKCIKVPSYKHELC